MWLVRKKEYPLLGNRSDAARQERSELRMIVDVVLPTAESVPVTFSISEGDSFRYEPWRGLCEVRWEENEIWCRRNEELTFDGNRTFKTRKNGGVQLVQGREVQVLWDNRWTAKLQMLCNDCIYKLGDNQDHIFERTDAEHSNDSNVYLKEFRNKMVLSEVADWLNEDLKAGCDKWINYSNLEVRDVYTTLHLDSKGNPGILRCAIRCIVDAAFTSIGEMPETYPNMSEGLSNLVGHVEDVRIVACKKRALDDAPVTPTASMLALGLAGVLSIVEISRGLLEVLKDDRDATSRRPFQGFGELWWVTPCAALWAATIALAIGFRLRGGQCTRQESGRLVCRSRMSFGVSLFVFVSLCSGLYSHSEDVFSFSVPSGKDLSPKYHNCSCVVFGQSEQQQILFAPLTFSVVTVVVFFVGNYVLKVFTESRSHHGGADASIAKKLWLSVGRPSVMMLTISTVSQVWYAAKAFRNIGNCTFWTGYEYYYVSIINSGYSGFITSGLYGGMLSEEIFSSTSPISLFRIVIITVCFIWISPIIATHLLPAILRWCWIFLLLELSVALIWSIFLPNSYAKVEWAFKEWQKDMYIPNLHKAWRALCVFYTCLATIFLPWHRAVYWAGERLKFTPRAEPLGPASRTLAVALLALLKCFQVQFLINYTFIANLNVDYLDAVVLALRGRSLQCQMCLCQATAVEESSVMSQAWGQLFTSLAG